MRGILAGRWGRRKACAQGCATLGNPTFSRRGNRHTSCRGIASDPPTRDAERAPHTARKSKARHVTPWAFGSSMPARESPAEFHTAERSLRWCGASSMRAHNARCGRRGGRRTRTRAHRAGQHLAAPSASSASGGLQRRSLPLDRPTDPAPSKDPAPSPRVHGCGCVAGGRVAHREPRFARSASVTRLFRPTRGCLRKIVNAPR